MRLLGPWLLVVTSAVLVISAFSPRLAHAQRRYWGRGGYYGGYYVDNRASTVGESYARGISDVIRAQGDYNLRTSQAAINVEEARSRNIDNRLKWTNTYFEMRRANKAARAEERGPPPSMYDLNRIAQENAPKRMGPTELDSLTGTISWPLVLQLELYAPYREQLEALFAHRASSAGSIGPDAYMAIRQTTEGMLAELRKHVKVYPPMDYIEGQKFIERLANEARFPYS